MGFLKTELFAGFTVLHVGGAVLGLFVLVWLIGAFKKKEQPSSFAVEVGCPKCGWHGTVGKYNRVCRKCNAPL